MNHTVLWFLLITISVIFSIFSRISVLKKNVIAYWFFEIWRDFVGYFFAVIIAYFFITVRYPKILISGDLSTSDFILFIIFSMCATGWLPYFIKNVTDGINAILSRVLKK